MIFTAYYSCYSPPFSLRMKIIAPSKTILPFYRSTVLPFYRSTVLPFYRSTVLPFCRSTVLPFCRSAVLAFVMVLPLESHALKWALLSPSPPRWSLLVDADEILFLRKKLGQVCLVLEDRTSQRPFLKGAGIRCNVSYQIDDKRFIHYQQEWMHSSSFKINPQN
jgi:hypothetical protein